MDGREDGEWGAGERRVQELNILLAQLEDCRSHGSRACLIGLGGQAGLHCAQGSQGDVTRHAKFKPDFTAVGG